jgi:hypothetical protein
MQGPYYLAVIQPQLGCGSEQADGLRCRNDHGFSADPAAHTLSSYVAACPFSSNAITTTAAPWFFRMLAWRTKASSPSCSYKKVASSWPVKG